MTIDAYPGQTVTLTSIYEASPGGPPVDPDTIPTAVIVGVEALGPIVRLALGLYSTTWDVPVDQAPGVYAVQWSAEVSGSPSIGYEAVSVSSVPVNTDNAFTGQAVKDWLKIDRADEDDLFALIVAAVRSLINGLPDIDLEPNGTWSDSTHLAALMLSARLYKRRNSPAGVEAFTDQGAAYVKREDSDVARLLHIDAYAPPRVG